MAAWNPFAIWLVVAAIVGFFLLTAVLIAQWKEKKKKKDKTAVRDPVRVNEVVGPAGRRRVRNARNRMNAARRNERDDDDDDDYNDVDDDGGGAFPMAFDDQMPMGKIGTKKLKKLEMKAEKKAMREQMEAEREDRKEREALREAERKREDERRKQEQERREEEERIRKEEEEKKAYEEYLAMKEAFLVEEEGVGETEEETQALLQDFINYIKDKKVVMLEDLACQFGLRTQEAINRLQILQESEQITGVIDDRGKFIYISKEELESVAKFIRQRGRVTITDLAESSNKLINLQANTNQVEATA
ncbi:DDRGK domain-containing protein 1-like [Actinia tenebrosa]|uniref:DDRGK domain-containing protein 1 n=1 Tax=Actinia tenebrosa TaxID=6105 RepID=A0A6P8H2C7_ACTTE|nr:DDRGK domain-containing protein 1-like [Actinia tenebrosa]